ncbi:hypothetical protein BKA70DRAFT_1222178 [Coprinopsis sp. MPI-PUGE-AT-0042]|nr:hypothetical protein BKA70DRAFT_1222178 [Coprinopsis sp. MPI-PUGE-AT-0042]
MRFITVGGNVQATLNPFKLKGKHSRAQSKSVTCSKRLGINLKIQEDTRRRIYAAAAEPMPSQHAPGTKLATITQAAAYRTIIDRKQAKVRERKATKENIEKVKRHLEWKTGREVRSEQIWKSLRTKAIHSPKTKAFLWKLMHEALPCGNTWKHNKNEEQAKKAECKLCGCIETPEHILTECEGTGQKTIWDEVKTLLAKKGIILTGEKMSKTEILSYTVPHQERDTSTRRKSRKSKRQKEPKEKMEGQDRLRAKIIGESAYLIWILRCEWQIGGEGKAQKKKTSTEAKNRWSAMIQKIFQTDIIATNRKKYKGKAMCEKQWVANQGEGNGRATTGTTLPSSPWLESHTTLTGVRKGIPRGGGRKVRAPVSLAQAAKTLA